MSERFQFYTRAEAVDLLEGAGVFTTECKCPTPEMEQIRKELLAIGRIIHGNDVRPAEAYWRENRAWIIRESRTIFRKALREKLRPHGQKAGSFSGKLTDYSGAIRGLPDESIGYAVFHLMNAGKTKSEAVAIAGKKLGLNEGAAWAALSRCGGPIIDCM